MKHWTHLHHWHCCRLLNMVNTSTQMHSLPISYTRIHIFTQWHVSAEKRESISSGHPTPHQALNPIIVLSHYRIVSSCQLFTPDLVTQLLKPEWMWLILSCILIQYPTTLHFDVYLNVFEVSFQNEHDHDWWLKFYSVSSLTISTDEAKTGDQTNTVTLL